METSFVSQGKGEKKQRLLQFLHFRTQQEIIISALLSKTNNLIFCLGGSQIGCTFATSHHFILYKGVDKLVVALPLTD